MAAEIIQTVKLLESPKISNFLDMGKNLDPSTKLCRFQGELEIEEKLVNYFGEC